MKVSILMPNYNHSKLLRRSIDSALRQNYEDLELIIVDDGSTDGSIEIIKEYSAKDSRVKTIFCAENMGFPVSFKLCCDLAGGEIVYGLASDDYILESYFISECVGRFKTFPEIGLVWAKTSLFYDDGEYFTTLGSSQSLFPTTPHDFLRGFLLGQNFVAGYSAVFRKKCLDSVGGFHFDLGPQADYFPNHAVPSVFGGVFIPDVMTHATVFRDKSNYCDQATEQQKIERHAQFEKRMRELNIPRIEEELWVLWRDKLIHDIAPNNEQYAHQYFKDLIK